MTPKKFSIVHNIKPETLETKKLLEEKLKDFPATLDEKNPEIVFVIGGDGTFLKATNTYNKQLFTLKFITLKQGHIGMYYRFNGKEIDKILKALFSDSQELEEQNLDLLEIKLNDQTFYSINEVRVINLFQTLVCDVSINKEPLQRFLGSGLIVSTKTGSTGLMKSSGAAIILANSKLMEMQEVFPVNSNLYRSLRAPIILDDNQTITFSPAKDLQKQLNSVTLVIDNFVFNNNLEDEIQVSLAKESLTMYQWKDKQESLLEKVRASFIAS